MELSWHPFHFQCSTICLLGFSITAEGLSQRALMELQGKKGTETESHLFNLHFLYPLHYKCMKYVSISLTHTHTHTHTHCPSAALLHVLYKWVTLLGSGWDWSRGLWELWLFLAGRVNSFAFVCVVLGFIISTTNRRMVPCRGWGIDN